MFYSFINKYITIDDFSPVMLTEFSPFRNMLPGAQQLFHVSVKVVDELPQITGREVYFNFTGTHVFLDGKNEYRQFRDIITKVPYAVLMDSASSREINNDHKKILYFLKRYIEEIPVNDRTLLNCIAPEKTMFEEQYYILHSSFVRTDEGAILFTAPSGTGKSTQADLWHKYKDAEVVNGDRSAIWRQDEKWFAGGVPWCGTSGIMKNEIVPLRTIVILDQAPDNQVNSLPLIIKMKRLLEQITINPWNKELLRQAEFDMMQLCEDIPILHLSCRPDVEAVKVLSDALESLNG